MSEQESEYCFAGSACIMTETYVFRAGRVSRQVCSQRCSPLRQLVWFQAQVIGVFGGWGFTLVSCVRRWVGGWRVLPVCQVCG